MSDPEIPEADRLNGALHPRHTPALLGQSAAEETFLQAFNAGRVHHAWLISGPAGVGKATLSWRIARFLLATPVAQADGLLGDPKPIATLDIPAEHPVARRVIALSEPRLFLLRRPWDDKAKRLKQDITVDEARKLKGFFALSAAEGGRRVVIIDTANQMNIAAANAVLKLLEEPPENTTLLLISDQPSALLPTIRSRCRTLHCVPLGSDDLAFALAAQDPEADSPSAAVAALAGGSVGAAVSLVMQDGVDLYRRLVTLIQTVPKLNRPDSIALADWAAARGAEGRLDMTLNLIHLFLARLARSGVVGPPAIEAAEGEAALFARLCPAAGAARAWAELHQVLGAEARHGRAVNLDPSALILDMILKINGTATDLASRERHVSQ
ncbi:DNA polymerase III subunit delta' [Actibacterium sp. 188UL27-1]|uniref:DNA polymerase III subunit delta' n=1 Tax=Actibacterium sp. 188UL27-1 TaxID=2786961 RepID=UPI0019599C8F|nr:DNA polymerase III subunit delta' [Actibacterium sp. 188UL27-1]MBM7069905.1 DNA polymerase III subunit delta' [Actibacterium sp. 188UL27-1]